MKDLLHPPATEIEEGYRVLVQCIDDQEKTPDFVECISDGNYQRNIIHDQIMDGKHTRISMFYIDSLLVLTCRSEISVEMASGDTLQFVNQTKSNEPICFSPIFKLEKNIISKVICDPYYNTISQLIEKNVVLGMLWEIYELPALWKAYSKKYNL